MQRVARAKQFQQRNMLKRDDVELLFPDVSEEALDAGRLIEFPIANLWLDDQPRQIVPDDVLNRLIEEGRAQPAALLAELRLIANTHPYYRNVYQAICDLARTIEAEGVLEPLLVVVRDGHHVVRDGHRRTLASLVAGRQTVPVRVMDEPSDVQAAARQLVVNIQREDLTALEKGRWLLRLARLVERQAIADLGVEIHGSVVDALVEREPGGEEDENDRRGLSAQERDVAAQVRKRVCDMTGLSDRHYYNLMYLNRLSPEAREAGIGLTEGQLRPVTSLPRDDQADIVRFIAQRNLTSKEANTLAQVAKSGDRDAVRRVMTRLAKEDAGRQRASVSWEPLMHALPRDLWPRCSALRAELGALSDELRTVRLKAMWDQRKLAEEFIRLLDEIFAIYDYGGADSAVDQTSGENR
jgi:hypothetical protein